MENKNKLKKIKFLIAMGGACLPWTSHVKAQQADQMPLPIVQQVEISTIHSTVSDFFSTRISRTENITKKEFETGKKKLIGILNELKKYPISSQKMDIPSDVRFVLIRPSSNRISDYGYISRETLKIQGIDSPPLVYMNIDELLDGKMPEHDILRFVDHEARIHMGQDAAGQLNTIGQGYDPAHLVAQTLLSEMKPYGSDLELVREYNLQQHAQDRIKIPHKTSYDSYLKKYDDRKKNVLDEQGVAQASIIDFIESSFSTEGIKRDKQIDSFFKLYASRAYKKVIANIEDNLEKDCRITWFPAKSGSEQTEKLAKSFDVSVEFVQNLLQLVDRRFPTKELGERIERHNQFVQVYEIAPGKEAINAFKNYDKVSKSKNLVRRMPENSKIQFASAGQTPHTY